MLAQFLKNIPAIIMSLFILFGCLTNRENMWTDYGSRIDKTAIFWWWMMVICSIAILVLVWVP